MSATPHMDRSLDDYPTISSLCAHIAIAMDWDTYESVPQVLKESADRVIKNEEIWRKKCSQIKEEEKRIFSSKIFPWERISTVANYRLDSEDECRVWLKDLIRVYKEELRRKAKEFGITDEECEAAFAQKTKLWPFHWR